MNAEREKRLERFKAIVGQDPLVAEAALKVLGLVTETAAPHLYRDGFVEWWVIEHELDAFTAHLDTVLQNG